MGKTPWGCCHGGRSSPIVSPMDNTDKRTYESPRLVVEGALKDLTLGEATGNFTDKLFPQNTPFNQLTFTN